MTQNEVIVVTPERTMIEQTLAESMVEDKPVIVNYAEIDPRVLKGVRFLDQKQPNWAMNINLKTFTLSHSNECVLGQLYGDYGDAANDFWGDDNDKLASERGFYITSNSSEEYEELEKDWRVVIQERQHAGVTSGGR